MGEHFVRFILLVGVAFVALCGVSVSEEPTLMTASDALSLERPEADHRLPYGEHPLQFGELRLPEGEGPHPIVIVIHGGCWLAEYDLGHISALADALTDAGFATWSIEYRRIGNEGGGWPGTFQDVAEAADHLRGVAFEYSLDLERISALGHSAGGHLAMWLAGRKRLPTDDPLRGDDPLALNGVVVLAGIPDLESYAAREGCGAAVAELLGGDPADVPERLDRSSPIAMLPFGVTEILVIGEFDSIVPESQAQIFAEAAQRVGDAVEVATVPSAGHFELVDPSHAAFEVVREAVVKSLEPGKDD